MNGWRDVRLPVELCERMERQLRGSQFENLEEFLTFVLKEMVSKCSSEVDDTERQKLEQRLRDLGYL